MISHKTNKKETGFSPKNQTYDALTNPLLHNHLDQMNQVIREKESILTRIVGGKTCKIQSLLIDPGELGRYKNFRGASSDIAKFIKNQEKVVRDELIPDLSPLRLNGYQPRRIHMKYRVLPKKICANSDSPKSPRQVFYAQRNLPQKLPSLYTENQQQEIMSQNQSPRILINRTNRRYTELDQLTIQL